jgi:TolB-like protein
MSDIFLSYATEDHPRTRVLVQALEARGWSVWWDRTIPPGQTWDSVIERALDAARCVVVLWSKVSVTSEWVRNEAEEASRRKILVPVLIDDVLVPLSFRRIQAARLVAWSGKETDEEFGKLIQAISEKLGTARPPAPPGRMAAATAPASAWRRRRPALLVGLGALAVLVGILAYVRPWPFNREPLVIGVMDIKRRGSAPSWMCDSTREGLNTVLSKVKNIHVYSRDVIDFLRKRRGLTNFEAAQQLGITKVVSGSISGSDQNLVLEIEIDDARGMIDSAEEIRGTGSRLIEMQNDAVKAILKVIKPELGQDQLQKLVANRTNDQLESYKLLTESMGEVVEEKEKPSVPPAKTGGEETSWDLGWPAAAFAADPGEPEVRDLLERYRTALESKSLDQITAVYVEMTPGMRDALTRYFATADDLKVRFSNYEILIEGNEAVATFTRADDFKDAQSGRDMHLEVRVSSVVSKGDGGWKIRGLKKPS